MAFFAGNERKLRSVSGFLKITSFKFSIREWFWRCLSQDPQAILKFVHKKIKNFQRINFRKGCQGI